MPYETSSISNAAKAAIAHWLGMAFGVIMILTGSVVIGIIGVVGMVLIVIHSTAFKMDAIKADWNRRPRAAMNGVRHLRRFFSLTWGNKALVSIARTQGHDSLAIVLED